MCFNITVKKMKFNSISKIVLSGKPTELIQTAIWK